MAVSDFDSDFMILYTTPKLISMAKRPYFWSLPKGPFESTPLLFVTIF